MCPEPEKRLTAQFRWRIKVGLTPPLGLAGNGAPGGFLWALTLSAKRAVLFIDGSNWYHGLRKEIPYYVEKQVDVRIAVDLVIKAYQDEYDVAYLLSADGDFVPAVKEVRRVGKKVFAASTIQGAQLARAVDTFIPLPDKWFVGLSIKDS